MIFYTMRHRADCLTVTGFNPLNAELNPICHMLALLGAHHILHVSRIRVKYRVEFCTTKILSVLEISFRLKCFVLPL